MGALRIGGIVRSIESGFISLWGRLNLLEVVFFFKVLYPRMVKHFDQRNSLSWVFLKKLSY